MCILEDKLKHLISILLLICLLIPAARASSGGKYDLDDFGYRTVKTNGRGSLVFQEEPRGDFMYDHKFWDGDQIYVNLYWRKDGYAIAYEDGEYGYVDASYIKWNGSDTAKDLSNFEYRTVDTNGSGALVFQEEPRGDFMYGHKFWDGDRIYVNVEYRKNGYAIAYQDGEYGYVDASYIDWDEEDSRDDWDDDGYDLSEFEYRTVDIDGSGALIFQRSPGGTFMNQYKYWDGDRIYVNVDYREDGYAIAYEDGVYGYVDARYIDW